MRKSRFAEERTTGVLREQEAGSFRKRVQEPRAPGLPQQVRAGAQPSRPDVFQLVVPSSSKFLPFAWPLGRQVSSSFHFVHPVPK